MNLFFSKEAEIGRKKNDIDYCNTLNLFLCIKLFKKLKLNYSINLSYQ